MKRSLLSISKENLDKYRQNITNRSGQNYKWYGWVKGEYKENLRKRQLIKAMYKLSGKDYKKLWKNFKKINKILIHLETRLDVLMFRSGLCSSLENGRRWIKEGKVYVDEKRTYDLNWIKARSYNIYLKQGDSFKIKTNNILNNLLYINMKRILINENEKDLMYIKINHEINDNENYIVVSLIRKPELEELKLVKNNKLI